MNADVFAQQALEAIDQMTKERRDQPHQLLEGLMIWACSYRIRWLSEYLLSQVGPVVQSGPFAGMKYVTQAAGSVLSPKLLGCYEAELHGVMGQIGRSHYDTVIDIGCGEGYYAVGLARLLPGARIHAFDTNPVAQELCRELATLNGVADRVTIAGECRHEELRQRIHGRTLLVCDCEGAEVELLDPALVPELLTCDLVVELHDFLNGDISRIVTQRFSTTHSTIRIQHSGRNPNEFSALRELSQLDQYLALWEGRPGPTPWVFLRPHIRH